MGGGIGWLFCVCVCVVMLACISGECSSGTRVCKFEQTAAKRVTTTTRTTRTARTRVVLYALDILSICIPTAVLYHIYTNDVVAQLPLTATATTTQSTHQRQHILRHDDGIMFPYWLCMCRSCSNRGTGIGGNTVIELCACLFVRMCMCGCVSVCVCACVWMA